jgi:hypothetical protein
MIQGRIKQICSMKPRNLCEHKKYFSTGRKVFNLQITAEMPYKKFKRGMRLYHLKFRQKFIMLINCCVLQLFRDTLKPRVH